MHSLILSATYADSPVNRRSHYHDCHQLLYVESGRVTVNIDGTSHEAVGGDLIILSRFEKHSVTVVSEPYRRFALRIAPTFEAVTSPDLLSLLSILVDRPQSFSHIVTFPDPKRIRTILRELCNEMAFPDEQSDYMVNLLFSELLLLLRRHAPFCLEQDERGMANIIFQIKRDFEMRFFEPFTLESVAASYHISPSYLSHQFKKYTGNSVMRYLFSCRMAVAKKLLAKTDLPVNHIADRCGFSDFNNFSRTFRQQNGCSPSGFRQQYQQETE